MILKSKKVKDYIYRACNKQGRYDLREDLFYYCIEELLEKDPSDFKNFNEVERYFIGMIVNQMNSDTSQFYKLFRNNGFTKSVNNVLNIADIDITQNELDKEQLIKIDKDTQVNLELINKSLLACDPLKVVMFRMYYIDNMSYEEISSYYSIRITSVKYSVKKIRNELKRMLI
jgi:RNA polymerase sigma factor (sigma-70 family)